MASDFDELEDLVMADMRKTYSEQVIDHFRHPRNAGAVPDADGYASVTGPCGDTMEIWLKVRGDRIVTASFWTDGCGPSIASGSMTTELARGKSVAEAWAVTPKDILNALGGLPEENEHCALLAANTLHGALKDYVALKKEPWKKGYRQR
jgi:nitrogen fixation NifU-like protein